MQYVVGAELPKKLKHQAFSGEFINNHKDAKRLSFMGPIHNEVIGPDMIGPARSQSDARTEIEPESATLRLLLRDIQSFLTPDPLNSLVVYQLAFPLQQGLNTAIPTPTILAGKMDDGRL